MTISRPRRISRRQQLALATPLLAVPIAVVIGAMQVPAPTHPPTAGLQAYVSVTGQKQGQTEPVVVKKTTSVTGDPDEGGQVTVTTKTRTVTGDPDEGGQVVVVVGATKTKTVTGDPDEGGQVVVNSTTKTQTVTSGNR